MEFILREEHLPLGNSRQANLQYYQWVERKRREQEKAHEERLQRILIEIEEQDHKNKKEHQRQPQRGKRDQSAAPPEDTYEKNLIWQQTVQGKISKMREEIQEEQLRIEMKELAPAEKKEKKAFPDPAHQGPVKAWEERFQRYLRMRDSQVQPENLFRPTINDHSRRIGTGTGKVEDRLIDYGQKLKEKKADLEEAYEEQLFGRRTQNNLSQQSSASELFFRLYKDGEKINRKKNEQVNEYSFTPEINRHSQVLLSKSIDKRKPLYPSRINEKPKEAEPKKNRGSEKGFSDFLKRNQALLTKIELHSFQKDQEQAEKENRQNKECTFAPLLNPRSLRIAARRTEPSAPHSNFHTSTSKTHSNPNCTQKVETSDFERSSLTKATGQEKVRESGSEEGCRQGWLGESQFLSNGGSSQEQEPSRVVHRKAYSVLRELESEPATERLVIDEEADEEDSIEREKETDWAQQLGQMELQIELMMRRVTH